MKHTQIPHVSQQSKICNLETHFLISFKNLCFSRHLIVIFNVITFVQILKKGLNSNLDRFVDDKKVKPKIYVKFILLAFTKNGGCTSSTPPAQY